MYAVVVLPSKCRAWNVCLVERIVLRHLPWYDNGAYLSGVSNQPRRLRVPVIVVFTLLIVNCVCCPRAGESNPDLARHDPVSLVLVGIFGDHRDGVS